MNNLDSSIEATEPARMQAAPLLPAAAKQSGDKSALRILWRDHLRIGLGPQWVAVAGYRRGLRPMLVHENVIPCDTAEQATWRAAVDALPDALAGIRRSRPAVTVVLSNHFVRYAVLPWSAAIKTEAEWLALARHRFSSVHGPIAEKWTIRVAPAARERSRITSAVDTTLLDAINGKINGKASLVSVQPYVMAAYNRLQPTLGHACCWLVIEEPDRLTLGLIQAGTWRAIRSRRKHEAWRMTLPRLLDREGALLGLQAPCAEVAVCTYAPFDDEMQGSYRLRDVTLPRHGPERDRRLAMVLE
ncbi:MAG: hypothetical protein K0R53_1441 [Burkholderiales bacterium]|nr:hypothetical protein [Burkholderiales bacterium]